MGSHKSLQMIMDICITKFQDLKNLLGELLWVALPKLISIDHFIYIYSILVSAIAMLQSITLELGTAWINLIRM